MNNDEILIFFLENKSSPDINRILKYLTDDEKYKASQLSNKDSYWEYIASRYLIRFGSEKFFKIDSKNIIIKYSDKWVKLENFFNNEVNISISHTKNLVCFALGKDVLRIWIDIEYFRNIPQNDIKEISWSILSDKEKNILHYPIKLLTSKKFLQYWTIKEAFSKAIWLWLKTPFNLISLGKLQTNKWIQPILPEEFFSLNKNWEIASFSINWKYSFSITINQEYQKMMKFSILSFWEYIIPEKINTSKNIKYEKSTIINID